MERIQPGLRLFRGPHECCLGLEQEQDPAWSERWIKGAWENKIIDVACYIIRVRDLILDEILMKQDFPRNSGLQRPSESIHPVYSGTPKVIKGNGYVPFVKQYLGRTCPRRNLVIPSLLEFIAGMNVERSLNATCRHFS